MHTRRWSALLFALLLLESGGVRAQALSATFPLNAPITGPGDGHQQLPDVGWTGSDFVVVWQDARNGRGVDLWGARLDATGTSLTRANAPLSLEAGNQTAPALAVGPGTVLVAWLDNRVCSSEVLAQLYAFDLAPLAPAVRLSTGACTTQRPAVAWNAADARWLVTWGGHGAGKDVHGAIVSSAGAVDVPDFVIAAAANSASYPDVTALASGFLVTWADDRLLANTPNVYATTVSATGAVAAELRVSGAAVAQTRPCAAGSGSSALVAWVEAGALVARRVTDALTSPNPVVSLVTATGLVAPACAATPGGTLVAVEHSGATGVSVYAVPLDTSDVPAAELTLLPRTSFNRSAARIAVGTSAALVVGHGQTSYVAGDDALARALTLPGPALADAGVTRLCSGASSAERVNAAWDGVSYLATWRDNGRITSGSEVTAQRLEPTTGRWLSADAGLYITNGINNLASYPWPAASDAGFFVSWGDEGSAGQLKGAPVSSAGTVGGRVLLCDISNYVNHHRSGWFGGAYLTVFEKSGTLRGRRTRQSGTVVQTETILAGTGGAPEELGVAALDDVALVAFLARDGGVDLAAIRLDLDGGVLDSPPLILSAMPGDEAEPAVAANGSGFRVVWSADGGAGTRAIFTALVDRQGLPSAPVSLGSGQQPSVAWTGASWLVAFRRADDVFAQRLDDSQPVDPTPIPVATSPELDRRPSLAAGPPGEVLVTWDTYVEAPFGNYRAVGRFFWDTRLVDAGTPDAGPDGGTPPDDGGWDGGATVGPDGGQLDGGETDGGETDGGETDGGQLDGGETDGGQTRAPARQLGLACATAAGPSGAWLAVGVLGAALARRRSTRRERARAAAQGSVGGALSSSR